MSDKRTTFERFNKIFENATKTEYASYGGVRINMPKSLTSLNISKEDVRDRFQTTTETENKALYVIYDYKGFRVEADLFKHQRELGGRILCMHSLADKAFKKLSKSSRSAEGIFDFMKELKKVSFNEDSNIYFATRVFELIVEIFEERKSRTEIEADIENQFGEKKLDELRQQYLAKLREKNISEDEVDGYNMNFKSFFSEMAKNILQELKQILQKMQELKKDDIVQIGASAPTEAVDEAGVRLEKDIEATKGQQTKPEGELGNE